MKKLFDNAFVIHFPLQDVLTGEVEKNAPKVIGRDDLLLFLVVLNMLTQCIGALGVGEDAEFECVD
jgi:hypothetical protein